MRLWIRLAVVLAACVWLAACQRAPDLSRLGSPAQRLIGHWATSDGNEEYFGPVDVSGAGVFVSVLAGGQPSRQGYRVLNEDPRHQALRMALLDDKGVAGEARTVTISEDGESAAVTQGQASLALARMDGATTPEQSRYVVPSSTAGTPARNAHPADPRERPPAKPSFGPPGNAPDGQYQYVLIGYDGMTPLYAWKRVTGVNGQHIDENAMNYSQGLARHHNYVTWLHTVAFAILLVTTLLFRKDIGGRIVLAGWGAAIVIGVLGVFVVNAPIIAGILEIVIGFVLLVRGLFPKSDMLA